MTIKKTSMSKVKGKASKVSNSPWTCVFCHKPIEAPADLARNPANMPYHHKCWEKAKDSENPVPPPSFEDAAEPDADSDASE